MLERLCTAFNVSERELRLSEWGLASPSYVEALLVKYSSTGNSLVSFHFRELKIRVPAFKLFRGLTLLWNRTG